DWLKNTEDARVANCPRGKRDAKTSSKQKRVQSNHLELNSPIVIGQPRGVTAPGAVPAQGLKTENDDHRQSQTGSKQSGVRSDHRGQASQKSRRGPPKETLAICGCSKRNARREHGRSYKKSCERLRQDRRNVDSDKRARHRQSQP